MKAILVLKTLSPITHGAENAGNESLIRREAINTPVGVRHIPVLTGNSLRHRLFREPIADTISAGWQMTKEQLRWLYNGGALDGKHPNVDVRRIARARELMPHVEALGCSFDDTIVAGKLDMGVGWLACLETMPVLKAILPAGWYDDAPLAPSFEFLSRNQYYRHDAARQRMELITEPTGEDYAGMPHGGEHVMPGAMFVCAMHADGLSDMACSALVYALEKWAEAGATVGGQASRGHGVVQPMLWTDRPMISDPFKEHLETRLDEIREFISTLYVATKEPKKSKKDAA